METKSMRIEYEETLVPAGESLEVDAADPSHVRILNVTQIGPDLRYQYAIIWENGDA